VLEFRGFAKNQRLRRDREARSMLPGPPHDLLSEHHALESPSLPCDGEAATPPQGALEYPSLPCDGEAATPPQGTPGSQPSTNGGGYSGSKGKASQVKASSSSRARDACDAAGSDVALLLAARFTDLFGRPARLRADIKERLERVVAEIGVDGASLVMEERSARPGAIPGSLAFFLPAFEERAATQPVAPPVTRPADPAGSGWLAKAERYVERVGWQLTDSSLRDELAARFRLAGHDLELLAQRGEQRRSQAEEGAS